MKTEKHMKTFYIFIKDGLRYTTKADNRYQARKHLEFEWNISLSGAAWEEHCGGHLTASGRED